MSSTTVQPLTPPVAAPSHAPFPGDPTTDEPITFDRFEPLEAALEREWVDANGLGGWASSTVTGTNTRRYHGLLVASLRPPLDRLLLWSRNEERMESDGEVVELGTNLYPGTVHPQGYRAQAAFRHSPWPQFDYRLGEGSIRKHVFVDYGRNTTCTVYENTGSRPVTLWVRPLLACRDYHGTAHENGGVDFSLETRDGIVSLAPYAGVPRLYFHHNGEVEPSAVWYRNFEFPRERERGLDYREDLFSALEVRFELPPGGCAFLAGTVHEGRLDVEAIAAREQARRGSSGPYTDPRANILARTSGSFVVQRAPEGKTIVAGYHWFTDWGRDTMIALPGLTLLKGQERAEAARDILLAFAVHQSRGMIPNRFPDYGLEPEYNTVDAALWFVHSAWRYFQQTGDRATVRSSLLPAVQAIIEGYRDGTRYGIRMDEDGLVTAGEPGTQLTWMDAKIGDYVVTPREGKAVEINALWYHALRCAAELARSFRLGSNSYTALAKRAQASFNTKFWNEERGCLYDVLAPDGPDASIRPNQILAVSLRADLLPRERAGAVLDCVTQHLLTPYGLRSLAPEDPRYRAYYDGGTWDRDTAYHQGTVWAWLVGPYVDALVRVRGLSDETRAEARKLLDPLLDHVRDAGLGSISEIFDGDAPHMPRGCVSQAWSVAEVLRVYHQYLT
jgi:predicted glycogen debranching enzyme